MTHKSPWIPLHLHSQYSILESTASIEKIVRRAVENQMEAVALTDSGNLFGAVEFHKACTRASIHPIIGCEFYMAPRSRHEKKKLSGEKVAHRIVLLAKEATGYQNLCKLSSLGYQEGFYYYPRIDKELLEKYHQGLICLSGCYEGVLSPFALHESEKTFLQEVEWYHHLFQEDFYLELQRHQMEEKELETEGYHQESWLLHRYQKYVEESSSICTKFQNAAEKLGIPLLASNNSYYMDRKEWKAHEVLINVQSGEPCEIWEYDSLGKPKYRIPNPKRRVYPSHQFHFRSSQEMEALFSDIPEAIANTISLAKKCSPCVLNFDRTHYPIYQLPEEEQKIPHNDSAKYLEKLCHQQLLHRYTSEKLQLLKKKFSDRDPLELVKERLNYEMSVINSSGLADYLLIVYDFIHWAKNHDIPIGPGRGSGVGSVVLYLIEISNIEPIQLDLFFERFLNPDRLSYPDIDVDICMERREEVIQYMVEKYGKEKVAQIITFGTMKAKSAIRDVGRVLNIPLTRVNHLIKLIPDDLNITIEKALHTDPELNRLYMTDEETKKIIDLAAQLEGSIRSTGIHAAGIVVSCDPLIENIPVCISKESSLAVTQYAMKPVESVGMLKIDFLGLKILTSIHKAVELIQKHKGKVIDVDHLPLDDAKTYQLINSGQTSTIFQLEGAGIKNLVTNLHVDHFEEIMASTSLYRPGPMEMIPSFINRKHQREKIDYAHPWLEEILSSTYGIMTYQEQVMQIAQKLANFSLGQGDILRKAMGKKDALLMAEMREKFIKGCHENEISHTLATDIFDQMEKFAAYGFNKSHAAGYSYIIYMTAYLKANYPVEWMASFITYVRDDVTQVAKYMCECRNMGIAILPPDINESGNTFNATASGIRFALNAIKGVGEGVIEAIIQEREKEGPFQNLYHFLKRMHTLNIGKKIVENLVFAGTFDFTQWSRPQLSESIESMQKDIAKEAKNRETGTLTFFSLLEEKNHSSSHNFPPPQKLASPLSKHQILLLEWELIGFFLTGHPLDEYTKKTLLNSLSVQPLSKISQFPDQQLFRALCFIEQVKVRFSARTQKKFAILRISDQTESFELPIWSNLYEKYINLIQEKQILYALLQVDKSERHPRLSCFWLGDLHQVNETMIQECEQAWQQAKGQIQKRKQGNFSTALSKKQPPPQKENHMPIQIYIDHAIITLKQILKIKKIFHQHAGNTPLILHFQREEKTMRRIVIDDSAGVFPSDAFFQSLQKEKAILSVIHDCELNDE